MGMEKFLEQVAADLWQRYGERVGEKEEEKGRVKWREFEKMGEKKKLSF